MIKPKYKQLYLAEKDKVELIFKLCPEAKLTYEVFERRVKAHAVDLEKVFVFGERVKND